MKLNISKQIETNANRLKTGLLLIMNELAGANIMDVYAMRKYNCYAKPKEN